MHISAYVWLVLLILFLMAEGATVALLAMLRPVLKKYVNPKIQRTNVDALVGQECTVIEAIDNLAATGRVKMGGMTWSARSIGEENIPAGTVVKIEAVQGVKLLVSPVAVQEAVR